jgi:drug/metabolite transporter (DMT)-like permease
METWVILALLFPALDTMASLTDKFLLEKRVRNCVSHSIVVGIVTLALVLVILFFVPLEGISAKFATLGMLAGMFYSVSYFTWFYAVSVEEISRVISIWFITPIIVLLFATIFLQESLPGWKYAAIFSAVAGAVLIGVEKFELKPVMRKGFWAILLSCLFAATGIVIAKHLLGSMSFWNVYVLTGFGLVTGLLMGLISSHARTHFKQAFRNVPLVFLSEGFGMCSALIFLAAASMTEVSKVSAMGSLQPLYVLLSMLFLSAFMPKLLKETFTKKTLAIKAVSVVLIVGGAYFVAL